MADPPRPAPAVPPAPRNARGRRLTVLGALVVVVAGVLVAALAPHGSGPDSARTGDCVTEPEHDTAKVVGCGDGSAAYRVAGKVEHRTEAAVNRNSAAVCAAFPDATKLYWRGVLGRPGYVLCLVPLKK